MTAADHDSSVLGRIVRPADYVRVLATPIRLRSPHFALHHLVGRPLPTRPAVRAAVADAPVNASLSTELSTEHPSAEVGDVDDCCAAPNASAMQTPLKAGGPARWLGLVVPKKHAKRAVTRVLVKRQVRHVAADCASRLEPGLWVVRLRSPFDPSHFRSAASDALKEAARGELRALFERAARGERDAHRAREGASPRGARGTARSASAAPVGGPPCAA